MNIIIFRIRAFFLLSSLLTGMATRVFARDDYFQQEVNYKIHVSLDDSRHMLRAFESLEYINNSPDTLGFIYFHLWPNAYSGNNTDLAKQLFRTGGKQKLFGDPLKRGWIDSLDFTVNGRETFCEQLPGQPDICRLILPAPLYPGDTIYVNTPFRVKLPLGNISRMGFSDGAYQVSQWYPKPAVYDINGWHPMPYLDQGEYYSEFGRFDVFITLPADYEVGASGDLQTDPGIEHPLPASMKTLHFSGEQIHDFAWVAGRQFRVGKSKVILQESGREVTTIVMYTWRQATLWENALEYVNRSILHFSEWIGDYPYNTFTAVQTSLAAGSGMEYPGLAIIGLAQDAYSLDEVITHEVCHNWFYSAIGTDERRFPFMDEGLSAAYEERYMKIYYPEKKLWEFFFRNPNMAKITRIDHLPVQSISEIQWLINARDNLEQPLDLPAPDYTDRNYVDLIYYKASRGFNYLRAYLGDGVFDGAIKEYYREWTGKHPSPEDLQTIFEKYTGKDLSWFFHDFIGTTARYDYKAKRLSGDSILVKNKSEIISPVSVTGLKDGSEVFTGWYDGFYGKRWIKLPRKDFSEIRLNAGHIVPEVDHINNNIRSAGLFRKSDPMSPVILSAIEDPERRTLVTIPLVNWNRADGFMAGLAVNNGFMLPKKIEYALVPFYTFREPGISGKGSVALSITPYENIIRKITFSLEGALFGATEFNDYHAIKPGIDIWFRNKRMISSMNHRIYGRFINATDIQAIDADLRAGTRNFWQFGYSFERSTQVNPFSLDAAYETGGFYGKASVEFNYRFSYYGERKGLDIRMFAGTMLKSGPDADLYLFAPSGRGGRELYLFQGDFPDRFAVFPDNFWSRQMVFSEGFLVTPVNEAAGYTSSVLSLSAASSLPGFAGNIPVKPFANLMYAADAADPLFFESGIKAGIWGFFEVYMPLLVSANLSSVRGTVKERIRFILDLESVFRLRM